MEAEVPQYTRHNCWLSEYIINFLFIFAFYSETDANMGLRLTLVFCRQLIIKEVYFNQFFLLLLNMLNKLFCLINTFDEAWTHFLVVCVSQSTLLVHHQRSYKYRYTIHIYLLHNFFEIKFSMKNVFWKEQVCVYSSKQINSPKGRDGEVIKTFLLLCCLH